MIYEESKKAIEKIRKEDETLFRMSISHLMDVGIRHFTEENINDSIAKTLKQDDSHSFLSNECQCAIIRTAGELAKIDHLHLLVYISQNVFYEIGSPDISYSRLKEIAIDAIEIIESASTLKSFIEEEELEALGLYHLIKD